MKSILLVLMTTGWIAGSIVAEAQTSPVSSYDLQPIVTAVNGVEGSIEETPPSTPPPSPIEPEAASTNPKLVCGGTNPPWILKVEHLRMHFQHSDYTPVLYSAPQVTPSLNSSHQITNYSGTSQDGSTMNAMIVDARINGGKSCNDKLSSQDYEFSVYINRGGQILDGCCWMER